MKTIMIVLALALLAGCAVVPAAPYSAYGTYCPSPYYASPVNGYYNYKPWHNGYYKPRYHGYYKGRGHGYHDGYRHHR